MTPAFKLALAWILATTLAVAAQLELIPAVLMPEGYVPFGNDAFYHARRILDAVAEPSAFYQFDPLIHFPDGSLLPWPWGYDYGMSVLVRIGLILDPAAAPMAVLAYLPVAAVVLMTTLLFWIARLLRLGTAETLLLGCCAAIWPMTQSLYGVGQIDHHFAEHLFILAFVATSLNWMRSPGNTGAAVLAGLVLGAANAVHTGLFVLQAIWLAALGLGWLRQMPMPRRQTIAHAVTLVLATLLVLLPSEPFHRLMWDFGYLSWLHLYVAVATAVIGVTLAVVRPGRQGYSLLAALCVLLAIPMSGELSGLLFFTLRDEVILQAVEEAKSTWQLWQQMGTGWILSVYSGMLLLVPLVWIGCVVAVSGSRDRVRAFFYTYALLALPIMLLQFRFYYYGSLALLLPAFLASAWVSQRWGPIRARAALCIVMILAFAPSARYVFGVAQFPGGGAHYGIMYPLVGALRDACAAEPAVILAPSNEGHPLRFHASCPVIANNFLLTPQHFAAVRRVNDLLQLDASSLRATAPEVGYVLAIAGAAMQVTPAGIHFVDEPAARQAVPPLFAELLWADAATPPAGYLLLDEVFGPMEYPLARLWKVERLATQSPASLSGSAVIER